MYKRLLNTLSIIREGYRSKKSIVVLSNLNYSQAVITFLNGLIQKGVIQGFELKQAAKVVVIILKHEKQIESPSLFQFKVEKSQSFKHGFNHTLSALRKVSKRGLTSSLTFISSDRGVIEVSEACKYRVGGKVLYSIK